MAYTYNDVVAMMRNVIGENDGDDPDASNDTLLEFVAKFLSVVMGQDIKSYDLYDTWDLSTVSGTDTYQFKDQGYTHITPPIYVVDSNNVDLQMNFFMSENSFWNLHPITAANETNGKPIDLLFANDQIVVRPPPDDVYTIKIRAYKDLSMPLNGSQENDGTAAIDQDYFFYYLAYGSALDWLRAFGNHEDVANNKPYFEHYRRLVLARTANQYRTQRIKPAL